MADDMPHVDLGYLFSCDGQLKALLPIGGPFGDRTVFEVIRGRVWGDGVSGQVLTGGADWMLIGADGWARLDVRAQFLLDDGTALYCAYHGLLEANDAVQAWLVDDAPRPISAITASGPVRGSRPATPTWCG